MRKRFQRGRVECPHCKVNFTRTQNRNKHALRCWSNPSRLQRGGAADGVEAILRRQIQQQQQNPNANQDDIVLKWQCPECAFSAPTKRRVVLHRRAKHTIEGQRRELERVERREERRREKYRAEGRRQAEREFTARRSRQKYAEWCFICRRAFATRRLFHTHLALDHFPQRTLMRQLQGLSQEERREQRARNYLLTHAAMSDTIRRYRLIPTESQPVLTLDHLYSDNNAREVLLFEAARLKAIMVQFTVKVKMVRYSPLIEQGEENTEGVVFFSNAKVSLHLGQLARKTALNRLLQQQRDELESRLTEYTGDQLTGSGWSFENLIYSEITIYKGIQLFTGYSAASVKEVKRYLEQHFKSPNNFEVVTSPPGACFYASIAKYFLATFSPDDYQRLKPHGTLNVHTYNRVISELGLKCVSGVPVDIHLLSRFEKANRKLSFRVNLHYYDEASRSVSPFICSKLPRHAVKHCINVLLLDLPHRAQSHFVLITSLGRLATRPPAPPPAPAPSQGQKKGEEERVSSDPSADSSSSSAEEEEKEGRAPKRMQRKRKRNANGDPPLMKISRRRRTAHHFNQKFVCSRCYLSFCRRESLLKHEEGCLTGSPQQFTMPAPGTIRKFTSFEKTELFPFFATADFEAVMKPAENRPDAAHTQYNAEYHPVCFALCVFNCDGVPVFERYEESDHECMELFFKALEDVRTFIEPLLHRFPFHTLSPAEALEKKRQATHCALCQQPFRYSLEEEQKIHHSMRRHFPRKKQKEEGYFDYVASLRPLLHHMPHPVGETRCVDHCHYSNAHTQICHQRCNLKKQLRLTRGAIPVFFHNFSHFDASFVVNALKFRNRDSPLFRGHDQLSALAYNKSRFRSINIDVFSLRDSLPFLQGSLEKTVETLKKSHCSFDTLKNSSWLKTEEQAELLTRKGVFPYSHFKSVAQYRSLTSLPPPEKFRNDLTNEEVSAEDYQYAQKVYKTFGMTCLMDYCKIYVIADTLLLGACLHHYRSYIYSNFKLDLVQFVTLSSLAYQASLKFTGVELELIDDLETYRELANSVRGGLSMQKVRHACSDSEHVICSFDLNSLYVASQQHPLPVSAPRKITDRATLDRICWRTLDENGPVSYFVVVDLVFPPDVHDRLRQLPIIPELEEICYADLSPYSKEAVQKTYANPQQYKVKKLTASFRPKNRHVCHAALLKYYLSQGVQLVKVHHAYSFRQRPYAAKFIEKLIQLRREAVTPLQASNVKLIGNGNYGYNIMRKENLIEVQFVTEPKKAARICHSDLFEACRILAPDLVITYSKPKKVYFDSTISVGLAILSWSKLIFFKTYYDTLEKCLRPTLLYMDTDSYFLRVRAKSEEEVLEKIRAVMDFSFLPPSHPLYDPSKRFVPGYLKLETPIHMRIEEAIFLRSKMYALRLVPREGESSSSETVKARAKGVSRRAMRDVQFETYRRVLFQKEQSTGTVRRIATEKYKLYLTTQNRVFLSYLADKSYMKQCGIHNLPYGHYQIAAAQQKSIPCSICQDKKDDADPGQEGEKSRADRGL